jgi:hypothetical protein
MQVTFKGEEPVLTAATVTDMADDLFRRPLPEPAGEIIHFQIEYHPCRRAPSCHGSANAAHRSDQNQPLTTLLTAKMQGGTFHDQGSPAAPGLFLWEPLGTHRRSSCLYVHFRTATRDASTGISPVDTPLAAVEPVDAG